ncbi:MAG: Ig-like domain repeat protein [Candidatus Sulfotelmatobacter sp.]
MQLPFRTVAARVVLLILLAQLGVSFLYSQTFTAIASMPAARYSHTATLLQDGTVLIAGGRTGSVFYNTAVIYNPTTKTFTATNGNMIAARFGHTATLLNNGMVLLAGGDSGGGILSSAELYDPTKKTFTATGTMTAARWQPTATLLNNGTVLIAGGQGTSAYLSSAEIYNPTTGSFAATGSMIAVRYLQTATLLTNGSVLMAGGYNNSGALNSAEVYVPSNKQFSPVGNMTGQRYSHTATLLTDSTVLIAGGYGNGDPYSAEIYYPSTLSFAGTSGTGTLTPRADHTATPLRDGTVLVAGGIGAYGVLTSAQVYTPSLGTFASTANMTEARANDTATLLNDGTVLVTGGQQDIYGVTATATAELYSYPFTSGALRPKYIVLGVIYSPPGAKSTVAYTQTTSVGTSTSISDTFTDSTTVSTSLGISLSYLGITGSLTETEATTWTQEADSSSTYTVNQTTTSGTTASGPLSSEIGVDHSYDSVLVWLNPEANLTVGAITTNLLWNGYSYDQNDTYFPNGLDVVQLSMFCLENPFFAPDCTDNNYLTSRSWDSVLGGLTLADYQAIASSDPFYVNPLYDPLNDPTNRFTYTGISVPFSPEPPGGGVTCKTGSTSVVATATDGQGATDTYSVAFTIDAGLKAVISADLKDENTMTWANKWSATETNSVGQTDQYSICQPLATDNYEGPTEFEVWQDNVYGTFMFVAPGTTPTTSGSIGVSPATLDFGPVAVGSVSSPVRIVLTNTSALPIFMGNPSTFPFTKTSTALSPVWAFSDPSLSVVGGSDACTGQIISPNATCTFSVQWTPTTSGSFSATMYLTGVTDAVVLATAPVNEVASKGTTTTALVSSLNPSQSGQAVTFTATVTFSLGETPAGETVTFMDGTTQLGTGALNGGSASFTTSTLPPGTNAITAVYAGDSNFAGSTSNAVSQVVSTAATTTALASSLNPSGDGSAVTFTATVTSSAGAPPNGETVTFLNGTASLGTGTLSSGSASLTTSTLPLGTSSITATYAGDSNFAGSTSNAVSQVVNAATTTTALVSSLNPSGLGVSVKFTATVSSGGGTPTGSVAFKNGTSTLATKTLSSGVATYSTTALPLGSNSITAVYEGSSDFSASTSAPVVQVVLTATTTTLSSSPSASAYGQSVIFTAKVTSSSGAPPNGQTVSFMKGTTVLGTGTLSGGSANFTDSTLAVGTNSIKAVYGGDANLAGSTSTAVSQVVSKATTTCILASSLNPSNSGQSVTFTATVEPEFSGTPAGTVTFYNGTTVLKTPSLSGGAANYTTTTLPVGANSITATYNGGTDFTTCTSPVLTQTVN